MAMVREKLNWKTDLQDLKSYKILQKLAETPYDLTSKDALPQERIASFCGRGAGFQLLYATERVNETVMHALYDLSQEAHVFEKMEAMQSGEILNFIEGFPSENRAVLHTALRDIFDQPHKNGKANEAREQVKKELDKLKQFTSKIDQDNVYTDLICVGIGGSELGPEATYIALEELKHFRHAYFIGNLDPDEVQLVLDKVHLNKCLVAVISKSGTTMETYTNETLLRARFKDEGLDPNKQFISITMPETPMDNKSNYLEVFHVWDWVGGRYSTTSMVGAVMIAFVYGYDVLTEFLHGAHEMDKLALQKDLHHNLPLLSALLEVWNRNFLNCSTCAIIPYSQALRRFPAHIQQVEMESNGKQIDRLGNKVKNKTGPIIWGEPGTNAQHSFYQLLHQGTDIVPMELIGFKESQSTYDMIVKGTTSQQKLLSNLIAQVIALAQGQTSDNPNKSFPGNRPTHILFGKQLTASQLGALLAYYEHKIAFEGFIWNINSFDQEGVQLGKKLADSILDLFAGKNKGTFPAAEAYIKQMDSI